MANTMCSSSRPRLPSTSSGPQPRRQCLTFGCKAVDNGYEEDGGFAINGGKGWSDCEYDNHQIEIKGDVAIAMGNYYFTCATTGEKSTVEYTFGYQRCDDDKVRIFLHHSSVPYKGGLIHYRTSIGAGLGA